MYYGRLIGEGGFMRTVAIKRLHAHVAKDPDLAALFLDEARLVARIDHPNVVKTLDVVRDEGELLIVLEYVLGESVSTLAKAHGARGERLPIPVVLALAGDALHGLDAAHDACDERGEPLRIVHRDVSPQNLLVGKDGVTRVLDFGIAKAAGRSATTKDGQVKGKLAYMAPEQLVGGDIDRRADVFAAGIVLWELLTGMRLFAGENEGATVNNVLHGRIVAPSELAPDVPQAIDAIVLRALSRDRDARFASAAEMAEALEGASAAASRRTVASWVLNSAGEALAARGRVIARLEGTPPLRAIPPTAPPSGTAMGNTVDVADDAREDLRSRRTARWYGGAALLLAVTLGVVLASTRWRSVLQEPAETLPTVMATVTPSMPRATSSTPAATASSSAPSSGSAPPVQAGRGPRVSGGRASPPTASTRVVTPLPVTSADCPVRSYVDAEGILRFKRVCP